MRARLVSEQQSYIIEIKSFIEEQHVVMIMCFMGVLRGLRMCPVIVPVVINLFYYNKTVVINLTLT